MLLFLLRLLLLVESLLRNVSPLLQHGFPAEVGRLFQLLPLLLSSLQPLRIKLGGVDDDYSILIDIIDLFDLFFSFFNFFLHALLDLLEGFVLARDLDPMHLILGMLYEHISPCLILQNNIRHVRDDD